MSGLYSVAAAVCASAVIVALLSHFVTDGGTKKLLSLVMGAFVVCSMLLPVVNAVRGLSADFSEIAEAQQPTADEEAYNRQILAQTKANLEAALTDLLAQNGISVRRAEIVLALTDENRVIISQITVTVSEEFAAREWQIKRVTEQNFSITPTILTEQTNE